jgi:hypothetical protein
MKFEFLEIPSREPNKPPARPPYIPIRILHNNKFQDLMCLVDSGADLCLFPSKIGEILGIDVHSGRIEEIGGIAEIGIAAYIHPVRLIVRGLSGVDVEAGFTESRGIRAGILGQMGFFDKFRITFERYKNWVDIADRP